MHQKQYTKAATTSKDKVADNHQHSKSSKGKPGGPTTDDRAKYGRNLSRAKNQGM
jgi:hypothetical protein